MKRSSSCKCTTRRTIKISPTRFLWLTKLLIDWQPLLSSRPRSITIIASRKICAPQIARVRGIGRTIKTAGRQWEKEKNVETLPRGCLRQMQVTIFSNYVLGTPLYNTGTQRARTLNHLKRKQVVAMCYLSQTQPRNRDKCLSYIRITRKNRDASINRSNVVPLFPPYRVIPSFSSVRLHYFAFPKPSLFTPAFCAGFMTLSSKKDSNFHCKVILYYFVGQFARGTRFFADSTPSSLGRDKSCR